MAVYNLGAAVIFAVVASSYQEGLPYGRRDSARGNICMVPLPAWWNKPSSKA